MGEHLRKLFVVVEDRERVFAKGHVKALSRTVVVPTVTGAKKCLHIVLKVLLQVKSYCIVANGPSMTMHVVLAIRSQKGSRLV